MVSDLYNNTQNEVATACTERYWIPATILKTRLLQPVQKGIGSLQCSKRGCYSLYRKVLDPYNAQNEVDTACTERYWIPATILKTRLLQPVQKGIGSLQCSKRGCYSRLYKKVLDPCNNAQNEVATACTERYWIPGTMLKTRLLQPVQKGIGSLQQCSKRGCYSLYRKKM